MKEHGCMKHRWLLVAILFALGAATALFPQTLLAQAFLVQTHSSPTAGAISASPETRPQPPLQSHPPFKRHPVVALTFDDLPAGGGLRPGVTRVGILTHLTEELRANHLKGVYGFVNAVDLGGDPDTQQALRIWMGAGMNIGNHTWSHPALSSETAADYEHNIALDEPALRQYAGKRNWHWLRFPYMEEGDTLAKRNDVRDWLRQHGYRIAEITLNFNDDDWSDPYLRCMEKHDQAGIAWLQQSYLEAAAQLIPFEREEQQLAFGHEIPNVLLLHATEFTTLMLPSLIRLLKQQGFRFASLPKVEKNRAYALDPAIGLPNGGQFSDEFLYAQHVKPPPSFPEPVKHLNDLCR
ncbi:MAG: polysaccharide deacetylase family protein [Acidobacteriaceae bacterium]